MNWSRAALHLLSNLLLLLGLVLLLFVGGIWADQQASLYAARGDTPIGLPTPVPATTLPSAVAPTAQAASNLLPATATSVAPTARPTVAPAATGSEGQLTNVMPSKTADYGPSTITRIVIPAIKVDRKVVEMGWTVQVQDGQEVAVWDVDKYRVGHHKGTSNPGGGGNIVLSGHSGGWQYPFNDIFYLKVGDLIQLTSDGVVYDYKVSDNILVDEVGQPLEKRLENARYIEPTDEEMITMVACWPLTGPDKFKQRIIIRARPVRTAAGADQTP